MWAPFSSFLGTRKSFVIHCTRDRPADHTKDPSKLPPHPPFKRFCRHRVVCLRRTRQTRRRQAFHKKPATTTQSAPGLLLCSVMPCLFFFCIIMLMASRPCRGFIVVAPLAPTRIMDKTTMGLKYLAASTRRRPCTITAWSHCQHQNHHNNAGDGHDDRTPVTAKSQEKTTKKKTAKKSR